MKKLLLAILTVSAVAVPAAQASSRTVDSTGWELFYPGDCCDKNIVSQTPYELVYPE